MGVIQGYVGFRRLGVFNFQVLWDVFRDKAYGLLGSMFGPCIY